MELDILIFAAHPDDAELSMGGTIAKLTGEGYKVGIVDLSQGELGTRGTPELRLKEAEEASQILKLTHRENLGFKDGNLKHSEDYLRTLIRKIREYKPKIIFAPYFNDRHPDHIGVGNLVKEAFFFSGLPKISTEQKAYRPKRLFYYMQTYEFKPSFVIDISKTFETKMNAVRAYKSQFYNPDSHEPETFISQPNFLKYIEARAKVFGFKIGKDYGEPFFCEEEIELDIVQLIK
ncbi:bacillithiol biosynthesis deacetylase BshB1 [Melioribacter sp. OK-1-Me]